MNERARVNVAAFHNTIDRVRREINTPGALGVTQIIRNVGDATIAGAEFEARLRVTSDLTVAAQAGYVDGEYDALRFDLNGDGRIDAGDFALELPRLSPWSYGGSVTHSLSLGAFGRVDSRVSFNHRDVSFTRTTISAGSTRSTC